jgi:AraC-like DNA-binding protein
MPITELNKTFSTADPLSLEFYEAQCARLSTDIDEPFLYTRLIRDQLMSLSPIPSLEQLAETLDIEARTLQRRLKKEDKSFSQLLQEVRLKRATDRLLFSNLPIEKIAYELGFNDAVAFSHAFKLWTTASPKQWRDSQST